MPIAQDQGGKQYTLGRGRVYFDRFPANTIVTAATRGEGERYIGNSPTLSTSSESEDLEHFGSDSGIKVKDDSVQVSSTRNGTFTTDNIDRENLALFFQGTQSTVAQVAATAATETLIVKRGRFYQLGQTPALPSGVRQVSAVVVKTGSAAGTTVAATGNYEVDEARGRLRILDGATDITENSTIYVAFNVAAATRKQVISGSQSIYGAIRFVADNPKGENNDYYLPYVKLSPDGDFELKGDDWLTIGFTMEILEKASNVAPMYIDGQAVLTP
jgi:hypothetical protein